VVKNPEEMKTKDVYKALNNYYRDRVRYCVENVYCFHSFYKETDFLIVNNNGYCSDIEVKVSRSDFLADKKKIHKHNILKNGYFQVNYRYSGKYEINEPIYTSNYPNKFYYCCPEGLIKESDLEDYQGLIYVLESGELKKIREAKFLHKEKVDLEPVLCRKFYYSYLQLKDEKRNQQ
jgi:hypothetical protein